MKHPYMIHKRRLQHTQSMTEQPNHAHQVSVAGLLCMLTGCVNAGLGSAATCPLHSKLWARPESTHSHCRLWTLLIQTVTTCWDTHGPPYCHRCMPFMWNTTKRTEHRENKLKQQPTAPQGHSNTAAPGHLTGLCWCLRTDSQQLWRMALP
jgi:hypothetical protein